MKCLLLPILGLLAMSSPPAMADLKSDLEIVLPDLPEATREIVVTLRKDGRMLIDAKLQPVGEDGLKALKKVALANTDAAFQIAGDPDVKFDRVVGVLNVLAAAKAGNIKFAKSLQARKR